MYYVNKEQIEQRLACIPDILAVCANVMQWQEAGANEEVRIMYHFAGERALQLAIETVTDVGSLLIDGFLMRDASSYEDIMTILHGESVFGDEAARALTSLVQLRRPLVQDYTNIDRHKELPMLDTLTQLLPEFADRVRHFIRKELA
jgi:uncharacterized protein YutE (UPF0331/DUF86 family)